MTTKLAVATLLLAGCVSEPKVLHPAPPGIALRASAGAADDTAQRAAEYCGQYGTRATRESTSQTADGVIVRYACE